MLENQISLWSVWTLLSLIVPFLPDTLLPKSTNKMPLDNFAVTYVASEVAFSFKY